MSRLPTPGADEGVWGDVLNDYLSQAHNPDGSLKPIAESSVSNLTSDLASNVTSMSLSGRDLMATTAGGTTTDVGTIVTNLSVGTVTTGAAGSAAAVTITGTAPDLTASFTVPQGNIGDMAPSTNATISATTYTITPGILPSTRVITMGANITFGFSGSFSSTSSGTITLVLRQDATGGRVVTWPATVKWTEGLIPIVPAAASVISVYQLLWDGVEWLGFVGGTNLA